QAIATEFLRAACHEGEYRSATATHGCGFRIQITEHNVRPIWCTIENWYSVLVIDESTATDWPILLSATVRSIIRHGTTAEEQTKRLALNSGSCVRLCQSCQIVRGHSLPYRLSRVHRCNLGNVDASFSHKIFRSALTGTC